MRALLERRCLPKFGDSLRRFSGAIISQRPIQQEIEIRRLELRGLFELLDCFRTVPGLKVGQRKLESRPAFVGRFRDRVVPHVDGRCSTPGFSDKWRRLGYQDQREHRDQRILGDLPAPQEIHRDEQEPDEGKIQAALGEGVLESGRTKMSARQNQEDEPAVGCEREAAAVDPCERWSPPRARACR